MDRRRSGIPGPGGTGTSIPKRAPSPSRAAFGSAGPLGGYRPSSRDSQTGSASVETAGSSRFGFASTGAVGKGVPSSAPRPGPSSSLLSKRSISNAGLQEQPHTPSSNGASANKRPFLTSANATASKLDHFEQEYKRKELLAQQAYERLQQELSAKGREVEKEQEERAALLRQWESLSADFHEERRKTSEERKTLKERVNVLQERNNSLSSRIDGAESEKASALQEAQTIKTEYGIRIANLEAQLSAAQAEASAKEAAKGYLEGQLQAREAEWDEERKRLELGKGNDADSAKLAGELSELLSKLRKLEADNLTLQHQTNQLQARKDSVEALKEQKRDLEKKVGVADELRRKVAEAEAEVQSLSKEKEEWREMLRAHQDPHSFEETFASASDPALPVPAVDVPEELGAKSTSAYLSKLHGLIAGLTARSRLLSERSDHARRQSDEAENTSQAERERANRLNHELEQAKMTIHKSEKARETMSVEVDGYRRLLETYQQESQNLSAQYDGASAEQIRLLEKQVESRNDDLEAASRELHELRQKLTNLTAPGGLSAGDRDRLESEHEMQQKELLHKLDMKQAAFDELEKQCVSLGKANDDLFARLGRGEFDQSKLRVLELTHNPVSQDRVIRASTLDALRKENAELLEQLKELNERVGHAANALPIAEGQTSAAPSGSVPAQTLNNLRDEYEKLQQSMRDRDKAFDRLKEAFGAKATEYVAAVKTLFGYDMHVLSKGKVKLRSVYARTAKGTSLTFDAGEEGDIANMRLIGEARQGAANVANLKKYWLGADRSSVPCFLAALQLELYESTTQAVRVGWTEDE